MRICVRRDNTVVSVAEDEAIGGRINSEEIVERDGNVSLLSLSRSLFFQYFTLLSLRACTN